MTRPTQHQRLDALNRPYGNLQTASTHSPSTGNLSKARAFAGKVNIESLGAKFVRILETAALFTLYWHNAAIFP
jgi:hypothetical protein